MSTNVAEWLRRLGLEQYEPAFRDNDIDARVLPRLTVEDLRELGIGSIGHRRRLLDAIAALGTPETPPGPTLAPAAPGEADAAFSTLRSRGSPRGDRRLPPVRRRHRRPLRRFCRQVYGRRRFDLFRLSAG